MAFNLIINPVRGGNPAKAINKRKKDPVIGSFNIRSMTIIE